MNWRTRYENLKEGDLCKPKPESEWVYKYYSHKSPIHNSTFIIKDRTINTGWDNRTSFWWCVKGSRLMVCEEDIMRAT